MQPSKVNGVVNYVVQMSVKLDHAIVQVFATIVYTSLKTVRIFCETESSHFSFKLAKTVESSPVAGFSLIGKQGNFCLKKDPVMGCLTVHIIISFLYYC